jgi:hypothetical protein
MSQPNPMKNVSRMLIANEVIAGFAYKPQISFVPRSGYCISWNNKRPKKWITRNGSFYPTTTVPFGGTTTAAITQLIRWVQNKPVLPIKTWRYWATVQLLPTSAVDYLEQNGYPQKAHCCLCGTELSRYDWWHTKTLSKVVEGCCCTFDDGCRQRPLTQELAA